MSNHRPLAMRICTKKAEIQDIFIANTSIKVLNISSLTSAIIRFDGALDQKFILFFENVFGEAPITFCKFFKYEKLILGFADGSLVIFEKLPNKSLLETNYERRPATLTSSPISNVLLTENDEIITIHRNGNCYEFVDIKNQNILTIPELKEYKVIFLNDGSIKIAFITVTGNFYIANLRTSTSNNTEDNKKLISHVTSLSCPVTLLQLDCDRVLLYFSNRISIVNLISEELISSFTLKSEIKMIQKVSSNDQFIELFTVTKTDSILRLKIAPLENVLEQEEISEGNQIFGCFVNEFFYILVTIDGIFIHDTLTNQPINKCSYPKYFHKYKSAEVESEYSDAVEISQLEGHKFLFVWGKSMAQIWDFNPKNTAKHFNNQKTKHSPQLPVGNFRKIAKYAVNSGIEDYQDEKREEDHLNHLRHQINIEGLTEEELIEYAKLLSKPEDSSNNNSDFEASNDPDLQMALKLSLIEM